MPRKKAWHFHRQKHLLYFTSSKSTSSTLSELLLSELDESAEEASAAFGSPDSACALYISSEAFFQASLIASSAGLIAAISLVSKAFLSDSRPSVIGFFFSSDSLSPNSASCFSV